MRAIVTEYLENPSPALLDQMTTMEQVHVQKVMPATKPKKSKATAKEKAAAKETPKEEPKEEPQEENEE
jgi:hypothetical protein